MAHFNFNLLARFAQNLTRTGRAADADESTMNSNRGLEEVRSERMEDLEEYATEVAQHPSGRRVRHLER